jgi:hypothetical protein
MKCSSVTSRFIGHGRLLGLLGAATLGLAGATSAQAQCGTYNITQGSGATIIPGTIDTGNHTDDGVTPGVALPFAFSFYGNSYNAINVCSNGNLQFTTSNATFGNSCLPQLNGIFGPTIFPFWDDLWTADVANGEGVFTSTTGSSPNRQFHIEYRAVFFGTGGGVPTVNFEVRLFEGSSSFDVIYTNPNSDPRVGGNSATIGVQNADGTQFSQYACNTGALTQGSVLHFNAGNGSGPPVNTLAFNPPAGSAGSTFLATSQVTPGCGPPSTGLTVSLDASSVGAGTIAMHDDGLNGDAVAGDNIFSTNVTSAGGTSVGGHTLVATVHDAQARSNTASATYTVTGANDDCGGAITVTLGDTAFDNSAATTSTPPATCGLLGSDLWYSFTAPSAGSVTLTTCLGTSADTAIAVYDTDCTTTIACDDDACAAFGPSRVCFPVTSGHVYKLRIGGYNGARWSGSFNLSLSTVAYNPPPGATPEGEDCNQIYPDSFNGGCNSSPVVYSNAEFCTNYTGTAANTTSFRDTDWWMFNLPTADSVTVHGQANFAAQCFFVNPTCPGALFPGTPIANPSACAPDFTLTFSLPEGPNVFFISPAGFDGSAQCGINGDYWFRIETTGNPNCDPTGACCQNTGCTVMTQAQCASAGGTYNGNGSHCSSCPATGGCCTANGCSIMTAAACAGAGGTYRGDDSTCSTFVDISGTGTMEPTTSGCDDCSANVPLPFPFTFYGTVYNDVNIISNGNLQFGTTPAANYVNDTPPSAVAPNNAIYPCWDDLYPIGGGDIFYQTDGSSPNRTFTVAWIDCQQYGGDGPNETFEVILYEGSNNIEFRYGNMPADHGGEGGPCGSDYTIGVENADGSDAVTVCGSDIGTGNTSLLVTPHATSYSITTGPSVCAGGPTCDSADFDCDGDTGTDFDIQAFFRCLAGTCPELPCTNDADFNNDGDVGTDADIEAFFRVLAGNPC